MLGLIMLVCSNVKAAELKDYQLIRRAFLEVINLPPTPSELDWYMTYNDNSYEVAVEWLVNQTKVQKVTKMNNKDLLEYLNSDTFKTKSFSDINPNTLQQIIKYQCGCTSNIEREIEEKMVDISIAYGENNTVDVFDYMSLCLISRVTNVAEANCYLEVFRQYPNRELGYMAVLQQMKRQDSFTKK